MKNLSTRKVAFRFSTHKRTKRKTFKERIGIASDEKEEKLFP
jgi:hypothetical protein